MIPVFEPETTQDDINYVVDALQKGEISGTYGKYLLEFEKRFAEYIGVKHGVTVTSGTTALHLAIAAIDLEFGDEVLISSSTNIATALAVAHNNALPVPVDSEEQTWNLDLDKIDSLITPKTKAIIPVHLFGHPVDMDRLMEIAEKYNLIVIEDCAESHGATVRGRMTGSFGQLSCFSFYANKIITTGEGGMVVTDNDALADRLRLLRNLGFAKPRFKHEVLGFNFRMTSYQAAMGLSQLERIQETLSKKRNIANQYNERLADIKGLRLPIEQDWANNVYWMYALVIEPEFGISRDDLASELYKQGIDTRNFFCPMNQQPCLQKIDNFTSKPCQVADSLWENGMYLPSSHNLSEDTIEYICNSIRELSTN